MSATPSVTFGLVEDSDEDFAAFSRVVEKDAPGTKLTRWLRAEATLESLATAEGTDDWPSILVVDLTRPGIDGCELVRRLRAGSATRTLPVFILSGSTRQVDIDRCYAAGANAYLTKPGSAAELRALLVMLFRSLTVFRAPTPMAAGPHDLAEAVVVPAPPELDEARVAYEDQLRSERDAERRARERAENLQRISARLANLMSGPQVETAFVGELIGAGMVDRAQLTRVVPGSAPVDPFYAPKFGSVGTSGVVPVIGPGGAALAQLEFDADEHFGEHQQSFLVEAAEIAGSALDRVSRLASLARRAARGGSDLPAARWWKQALEHDLRRAAKTRETVTVIALEIDGFDRIAQEQGAVAADRLLLTVADAWRNLGHDLLSRHGGEEFTAVLVGVTFRQARLLISEVRRAQNLKSAFSTGIAEWDGKEDGAQLVARAEAALVEERRLRATY